MHSMDLEAEQTTVEKRKKKLIAEKLSSQSLLLDIPQLQNQQKRSDGTYTSKVKIIRDAIQRKKLYALLVHPKPAKQFKPQHIDLQTSKKLEIYQQVFFPRRHLL